MKFPLGINLAIVIVLVAANTATAERSSLGSKVTVPKAETTTLPVSALLDLNYDYEVYSATDVSEQTEFVIEALFSDGSWGQVHRYEYFGSADRGFSKQDMGIWKFTTWWSAYQAAENLADDGEIEQYEIIEQAKQPNWQFEASFDKRADAEALVAELNHWADVFGIALLTKIETVQAVLVPMR